MATTQTSLASSRLAPPHGQSSSSSGAGSLHQQRRPAPDSALDDSSTAASHQYDVTLRQVLVPLLNAGHLNRLYYAGRRHNQPSHIAKLERQRQEHQSNRLPSHSTNNRPPHVANPAPVTPA